MCTVKTSENLGEKKIILTDKFTQRYSQLTFLHLSSRSFSCMYIKKWDYNLLCYLLFSLVINYGYISMVINIVLMSFFIRYLIFDHRELQ